MNRAYDLGWLAQTTMNWNFFAAASILVGGLLIKFGAPIPAVAVGVVLVALWNWKQSRGTSSGPRARR